MNDITRIIGGLTILSKYKPDAYIHGVANSTSSLWSQEEEYINIFEEGVAELEKYGWRRRDSKPYLWRMATKHGLDVEKKNPNWFK